MRTLQNSLAASSTSVKFATSPSSFPATTPAQMKSPWHSPVPYLFGGLAAMLGLIAFALLLLACSYWRVSGSSNRRGDTDIEDGKSEDAAAKVIPAFEEKIVVIMAGDIKPTFLATPIMSSKSPAITENSAKGLEEVVEKPKQVVETAIDQTSRSQERHEEQRQN